MSLVPTRYVTGHLRHGFGHAVVLGVGLLVASVSATLLSAAVATSTAQVQGTVAESFRTTYDVLVRPSDTRTRIEAERGLVRNNVESGIYGGITREQWHRVLDVPGVEVAAPVQYVGYVMGLTSRRVRLPAVAAPPGSMFLAHETGTADTGLSHYPGSYTYFYVARTAKECEHLGVFGPYGSSDFSQAGPASGHLECLPPGPSQRRLQVFTGTLVPMLVAAIDPTQENKLLDLDEAVVDGAPLADSLKFDKVRLGAEIPVIASSRTYLDHETDVELERITSPPGQDPASRLYEPALAKGELPPEPNRGWRWLQRLPSTPIPEAAATVSSQQWHRSLLTVGRTGDEYGFFLPFSAYFSADNPSFQGDGDKLVPRAAHNQSSTVWSSLQSVGGPPQANRDVDFRGLTPYASALDSLGAGQSELRIIGEFDPTRLPGSDPLNRVPLETYFPPLVEAGDARSERLMGGEPLRPSWNVGGYVATPPALLTTLRAARGFTSPRFFTGTNPQAPLSVIRVRVAGVTGVDDNSIARIERVATLIHQRTGLAVDITAGSSPAPQTILLPDGRFGRPELTLEEGWAKKGVALVILSAVDRKSLVLLGLILLTTVGYLANAALAAVRARRREIAILLSLGWPRRAVFGAVLGELAVVGLVAGMVGAGLAAGVVEVFDLRFPLVRVLFIPLLALVLTLLAGLLPALQAARGNPAHAVEQHVSGRTTRRATRHLPALAWANLRRVPARSLVAATGLFLGIGSLTALVAINRAFHGTVAGTLLGDFVAVQVRTVDYVAVGLTIGLATFSLVDVLLLNARERAAETATLQAVGWSGRHIGTLTGLEALIVGGSASLAGVIVGAGIGLAIGGSWTAVLTTAAITGLIGVTVTSVAGVVPGQIIARTPPARALALEGT